MWFRDLGASVGCYLFLAEFKVTGKLLFLFVFPLKLLVFDFLDLFSVKLVIDGFVLALDLLEVVLPLSEVDSVDIIILVSMLLVDGPSSFFLSARYCYIGLQYYSLPFLSLSEVFFVSFTS